MSKIISGELLKNKIRNNELIEQGKEGNCKGLKYDLVFSGRYLKAQLGTPVNFEEIAPEQRKDVTVVKPGEVLFVNTEEIFNLPQNYYAQLSPKRNMGELGINVNGALFVDPGYHGKLVFGLYNFSSENFRLQPGKTFASAVIHELASDEIFEYDIGKSPKPIMDFSPELINMISKCEPIGITEVSNVLQSAIKDIELLKQKMIDNDNWKREIQKLIEETTKENSRSAENISNLHRSINDLKESIQAESTLRNKDINDLKESIQAESVARNESIDDLTKNVDKKMIALQTLGYIITTILIAGGGSLLIAWLTGLIQFK